MEIKNALIRKVRLGFEDHGFLTAWLDLDYGGVHQGFGGYGIGSAGANYCGEFIKRTLNVVGVREWSELPGKTIRVKREHTSVHAIGHIIEDRWFAPGEVFEEMEKAVAGGQKN